MDTFVSENSNNEYIQWGLVVFNSTSARAILNSGNQNSPVFTESESEMMAGIDKVRSEADNGGTPYGSALNLARQAIVNDMQAKPEEDSFYMIIFLSDGQPTDNFRDNDPALNSEIDGIMQQNPGRIALSTGYYGPDNYKYEKTMEGMASTGGGLYSNFRYTDRIDFEELIVKPTKEPWSLKEFVVYNLNSTVCIDGQMGPDSDSDGLCDKDEEANGFDPTNKFTMGDGYGDYFHWREYAYGESLPTCFDRTDLDFDLLTFCEEQYLYNANPLVIDDFRGDPENPDTDLDGILDGIEAFNFRTTRAAAVDTFNTYRSYDDEKDSARVQIIQGRNPEENDEAGKKQEITINNLGVNDNGQNCYDIETSQLVTFNTEATFNADQPYMNHDKNENVYMVYYLQVPQNNPNSKGIMNYFFEPIGKLDEDIADQPDMNGYLKVVDGKFEQYIVPRDK